MPEEYIRAADRNQGRPSSPAWSWFTVVVPKAGRKQHPDVHCNFCNATIKNAMVSRNLLPHLTSARGCRAAPRWVVEKASDMQAEAMEKNGRVFCSQKRSHYVAVGDDDDAGPRKQRRSSLLGTVPSSRFDPQDPASMRLQIAKAIFTSNSSFSIIQKPEMRAILEAVCPNLPTRQTIATKLLDEVYSIAKAQMKEQLKQQLYVTLVTDSWTNPRNKSIFNFVLTAPGMRPVFWSSVEAGENAHDGEYLAKIAEDAIKEIELEIGRGKVVGAVSDSAGNVVRSWRLLRGEDGRGGLLSHGCAAHVVNLLVKDIFNKIVFFRDVLENCVFVAKFVKNRQALEWRFGHEQEEEETQRSLKLPVATRWYSHEICVKSVIQNKNALLRAFQDDELMKRYARKPEKVARAKSILRDATFWAHGKIVLELIAPITECIAVFENNNSPLSVINDRFLRLLRDPLYTVDVFGVDPEDQEKVLNFIKERWEFVRSPLVDAAYLLDPHMRTEFVGEELLDAMHKTVELATSTERLDESEAEAFRASLERFAIGKQAWGDAELARNRVCRSAAGWWGFRQDLSKLWRFAAKIFSIPASSAASERSWSVHSYIHSKQRASMLPRRVEKLVYVYSNAGAEQYPKIEDEDLEIMLGEDAVPDETSIA